MAAYQCLNCGQIEKDDCCENPDMFCINDMCEEIKRLRAELARSAIAAADRWLESPPTNQCGETCERAKLCATCARGLEPLTDGQIVECFVRAGCSGIRKTTYESGPYDITNPTLDGINIVRAIERAHGIAK